MGLDHGSSDGYFCIKLLGFPTGLDLAYILFLCVIRVYPWYVTNANGGVVVKEDCDESASS